MVFFGLQYLLKEYLVKQFTEQFFCKRKSVVVSEYQHFMDHTLGKGSINVEHIAALHDLGYLPMCIKAVPEGTCVPLGTPAMTLYNTHPDFFWLTNYLETLLSASLWKMCTSATTAREFRINFNKYAKKLVVIWTLHSSKVMTLVSEECLVLKMHVCAVLRT